MFSGGFLNIVAMSLVLGAASYGVGLVPLSMPLSKERLSFLSDLGTGLLIGTALGVILPEGVEQTVADTAAKATSYSFTIGIPILLGFAFMFLLEEYASSHEPSLLAPEGPTFDVDLGELGRQPNPERPLRHTEANCSSSRAYPLSLGLIIHGLVDGYALGVSASNTRSLNLSLIVFLAIIVHKAPTALSLTTALLANSLSVIECRKHLLYFSLATPVSSVLSYGLYALRSENQNAWIGSALLFSGGTFLYVASVLQPLSGQASEPANEIRKTVRTILVLGGMLFPVLVSRFVVHEHH